MGWMRTFLLGDIGNRLDIGDNEDQIRRMRRSQRSRNSEKAATDRTQDEQIAELRTEIDELQIALGTISKALVSKGVFTQDELSRLVNSIES
jgi:hypothetical protein